MKQEVKEVLWGWLILAAIVLAAILWSNTVNAADVQHASLELAELHDICRWSWTGDTQRNAETPLDTDVGKCGIQTDTNQIWYLKNETGPDWQLAGKVLQVDGTTTLCTTRTGYAQGDLCWDQDANQLYICESTDCDGSGWVQASVATHAASHSDGQADAVDHDNLTNGAGNKHIDWTLASQGTIHSSNYAGGSGAMVEDGNFVKPGTAAINWTCPSGETTSDNEPCIGTLATDQILIDFNQDETPDLGWNKTGTHTYQLIDCVGSTAGTCDSPKELFVFLGDAAATNQFRFRNAVDGTPIKIDSAGSASNIDMGFQVKGDGLISFLDGEGDSLLEAFEGDSYASDGANNQWLQVFSEDSTGAGAGPGLQVAASSGGLDVPVVVKPKGGGKLRIENDGTNPGYDGFDTETPWFSSHAADDMCIGEDRTNGLCFDASDNRFEFQGTSGVYKQEICGGFRSGDVSADEHFGQKTLYALNVTDIHCIADTGTATLTLEECSGTGTGCATVEEITCNTTGGTHVGGIDDAAVAAGAWMNWVISGSPTATEISAVFYCQYTVAE